MNHPSYPNPTIVEAICEIKFSKKIDAKWSVNEPITLLDAVKEFYPHFQVMQHNNLEIEINDTEPNIKTIPVTKIQFKSADEKHIITVLDDIVGFSFLAPYLGWEASFEKIRLFWPRISEIIGIESIIQIGTRYINKVEFSDGHPENLIGWLNPKSEYIQEALITSKPPYQSRLFRTDDTYFRTIVNLAYQAPPVANYDGFILDIDKSIHIPDTEKDTNVFALITKAHDEIYTVFSSIISEKYLALLKGQ